MAKYYAGIDVSKSFHVCYVVDENEKVVGNKKFNNDNDGYEKFFSFIQSIDNELNKFSVVSIIHNPELKKIYNDYYSRHKSKKKALIVVAKKLAQIFYGVYKNNKPYNPNRVFIFEHQLENK